jgi:predicted O-methyltransferase YrrM
MREYWKQIGGDMFDFPLFYEWISSTLKTHNNGIANLAEVGVADGKSSIFLAEAFANKGKSFNLRMIDNLDYGKSDQLYEIIKNVQRSGLGESIQILPYESTVAASKLPNELMHFVFIDASHKYEETKADIRAWWPKMMPDSILGGHDFTAEENPEVAKAVREVIPEQFLKVEQTNKGYGIWYIKKSNGAYIK